MSPASQWRPSSNYDYVDGLSAPDWAWEWLRRNGDYQKDFQSIAHNDESMMEAPPQMRQRWGVCFHVAPAD